MILATLAASYYTLPVSTTHVSTGAIIGAGPRQGVAQSNGGAWRRLLARGWEPFRLPQSSVARRHGCWR